MLNNANELITISQDRQSASEVMRALKVYAKSNQIDIPEERFDHFDSILIDSRAYTLSYLIQQMAKDILRDEQKKSALHAKRVRDARKRKIKEDFQAKKEDKDNEN
jgi:hypothetical protein